MKISILISVCVVLFFSGCSTRSQEVKNVKKIPVKLIDIEQEEISIPIATSGILSAQDELLLSFKTGGIVKKIYVKEGQTVKSGQLLAQLNLAEISAYKEQALAAFEKAKRDFDRIENLFQEKVATLEQKQNALSALDVAKANLQIASFNEKHSRIIAPANGKIFKKFVDAEELVGAGTPVISFGSTEKAFVLKTGVIDKDVILLQKGDPADIQFDAYPQQTFSAIVTQISGSATPGSGLYDVELQLEKTNKNLFSGFVGKAIIHPQVKQKVSTFPANALKEASENNGFVYIVNDQNLAEKKQINIAFIMDNKIAFYNKYGLTRIVNEGNAYLYENAPVEITN